MSATPVSAVGHVAHHGSVAIKVFPTQLNDATHVATNPDQGRILMQHPVDGSQYTVASSAVVQVHASGVNGWAGPSDTPTTLIKEAQ